MMLKNNFLFISGTVHKCMKHKKMVHAFNSVRKIGTQTKLSKLTEVKPPKKKKQTKNLQQILNPNYLQYISGLDVLSRDRNTKKAGIICTIGPASRDVETLTKMMGAGMDVARLNFSHGSHEYHKETIANVRKAVEIYSAQIGRPYAIGIALDTKGPEIRTGVLEKGVLTEVDIKPNSEVSLHTDSSYRNKGTGTDIFVDYQKLPKTVKVGSNIFIDDGHIQLKVLEIGKDSGKIKCAVLSGGKLGSNKGINIPGANLELPILSERDKGDLRFGMENNIDAVFVSFVRSGEDVEAIRKVLGKDSHILVISKIENHQGIENMDEIIELSDGIMVARGDLGVQIPPERVFLVQKKIIAACNMVGKVVICATQMLDSMITKSRPTRAEGSDVANAILDGADCVMLSGETAKGKHPIKCVSVMSEICKTAESAVRHLQWFQDLSRMVPAPTETPESIAIAAVAAANKVLASAILVITSTGTSAIMVAKFRPPCKIYAITLHATTARRCCFYRGIVPVIHDRKRIDDWALHTEDKIKTGLKVGFQNDHIHVGERVIVMTGWRKGKGNTSTMRILLVTEELNRMLKSL